MPALICLSVACGGNAASGGAGGAASGGRSATGGLAGASTGGFSGAAGGSSGSGGATGGAMAGAMPPSCQSTGPGRSDCGANGESCCTSVKVPGGTFYRSYSNTGSGPSETADPATLSDFRLDTYLVTVGRYRQFVAAWDQGDGYTPDAGSGKHSHLNGGNGLADSGAAGGYESGWVASYSNKLDLSNDSLQCQTDSATWTIAPGDNEKLPMNCVSWYEAYAFCIWDGGFLASEAEYVYAAAGGSEQRRYPWGATEPGTTSQYAVYNCSYPDGAATCDGNGTTRNIAPVGTAKLGAGRWGHLDLVGNLMEWYLDWFAPSYGSPCKDCANLADGSGRALRDGYFASTEAALLRSSYRNNGFYPANRFASFGFRCARSP